MTTDSLVEACPSTDIRDTTTAKVEKYISRTLVLIKPDAIQNGHKDEIIKIIEENGFKIIQEREIHLSKKKARSFYKEHAGKNFYKKLIDWMNSVPIYAMVLEKDNAIQDWKELIGPTDAKKARETKPHSIRALFGTDGLQNAVHGSDSEESVKREIEILFGSIEAPDNSNINLEQQVQATEVHSIEPTDKEKLSSDMQVNGECKADFQNGKCNESAVIDTVRETADNTHANADTINEQEKEAPISKKNTLEFNNGTATIEKNSNCDVEVSPRQDKNALQQQNLDVSVKTSDEEAQSVPEKVETVGTIKASEPKDDTLAEEVVPEQPVALSEDPKKEVVEEANGTDVGQKPDATNSFEKLSAESKQIDELNKNSTTSGENVTKTNDVEQNAEDKDLHAALNSPVKELGNKQPAVQTQAADNNGIDVTDDNASAAIIDTIVDEYTKNDEEHSRERNQPTTSISAENKLRSIDNNSPMVNETPSEKQPETLSDLNSEQNTVKTDNIGHSAITASENAITVESNTVEEPSTVAVTNNAEIVNKTADNVEFLQNEPSIQQKHELSENALPAKASNGLTVEEDISKKMEGENPKEIERDPADVANTISPLQKDETNVKPKDEPLEDDDETVEAKEPNIVLASISDEPKGTLSESQSILVINNDEKVSEPEAKERSIQSEDSSSNKLDNTNLSEQKNDTISPSTKPETAGVTIEKSTDLSSGDKEDAGIKIVISGQENPSPTDQESKPRLNKVSSTSVVNDKRLQLKPKPPSGASTTSKHKSTAVDANEDKVKKTATSRIKTVNSARANSKIATPSKTRKSVEDKEKAAAMTTKKQTIPSRLISPSKKTTTAVTATDTAGKELSPKKATTTTATTKRASLVSRLTAPTAASALKKSTHASASTADVKESNREEQRLRKPNAAANVNNISSGSRIGGHLKKLSPTSTSTLKETTTNKARVTGTSRATVSTKSAHQGQDNAETEKNNEIKSEKSVRPTSSIHATSKKAGSSIPTRRLNTTSSGGSRTGKTASTSNTRKAILSKGNSKSKTSTTISDSGQSKHNLNNIKKIDKGNEASTTNTTEQAQKPSVDNTSSSPAASSSSTDSPSSGTDVKQTAQNMNDENDTGMPIDINDDDNEVSDSTNNKEVLIVIKSDADITSTGNTNIEDGKQYNNHDSGSCTPKDEHAAVAVSCKKDTIANAVPSQQDIPIIENKHETSATTQTLNKKPQMASLRDKFENLSYGGAANGQQQHQQQHLSRSSNRISDMINRFTNN